MSRSRKKTPIFTYIGESNKISKRFCNRKFRTITRRNLKKGVNPPVKQDEVMTEWEFNGDGKRYLKNAPKEYLRK